MDIEDFTLDQIKNEEIDGNIYCYCLYEFKDELKKLGFKWDPYYRLWCIPKKSLTDEKFKKSKKVKYANRTTIGILNYYYVYYKYAHEVIDNSLNDNINT